MPARRRITRRDSFRVPWSLAKRAGPAASPPPPNEPRKLPAAQFTAKVRADVLATTDYVKKNLQNKEIQFIDTRTVKENSGDDIRALRGGYIAAANHATIPYETAGKDPAAAKN